MIHNDDDKNDNKENNDKIEDNGNKAGYSATPVACGWAGAITEVSGIFGQEQYGQNPH